MKVKINDILFKFYISLFIFCMINREFLLFGLDLRFILLPLGFFLIFINIIINRGKIIIKKDENFKKYKYLIIFYIWIFISNVSWLWNGIEINQTKFINENILLINIFISAVVIILYKEKITMSYINKNIVFSTLILVFSMILVSLGFDAKSISASTDVSLIYKSGEEVTHTNLFGWNFRPAGYASDPNYATLLLFIASVSTLKLNASKLKKIILLIPFIIGICMAFSKTVIIAGLFAIIYILFAKYIIKNKRKIYILSGVLLISMILISIISPFIPILREILPNTLTIRLVMWEDAVRLFAQSPIIGNGITSFRSFFAIEHWFVQSHNTYLQILSETGIVGIILFYLLMINTLKNSLKDSKNFFITIVFIIFMLDFETIALQFIMYIIVLSQIESIDCKKKKKKALFMINSLKNGGAERVCINMANELVKRDYEVHFILFDANSNTNNMYEFNSKIKILNLNINTNNKIKKIIKIIFSIPKVNGYIEENEEDGEYLLITSHLPMSNILTRLSNVKKRAIYVFHLNMSHYGNKNNLIFKAFIKFMFFNKKVVTVSEGVRQECINDYNMNKKFIRTIYNPINISEIKEKMLEPINIKEKYFLHIGRLSNQKRQDRMLEIFKKGEFYKNYKLLLCGTGDLLEKYKERTKELGIDDKVIFLGWQQNSYKWMKNAEILVCTSDNEAFPMTLIEALTCKTKVVSSNCKFGPNEILVNEYSNFLVEPDDIEGYIEKINLALKSYPEEKNPVLEKCDVSNVIDNYLKYSTQIIK